MSEIFFEVVPRAYDYSLPTKEKSRTFLEIINMWWSAGNLNDKDNNHSFNLFHLWSYKYTRTKETEAVTYLNWWLWHLYILVYFNINTQKNQILWLLFKFNTEEGVCVYGSTDTYRCLLSQHPFVKWFIQLSRWYWLSNYEYRINKYTVPYTIELCSTSKLGRLAR